ncbi:MAG: hypothetical protein QNJ15_14230 [Erythrobacter sp.]|nr:hypothetical protein [Erythrobacter sp.]
MSQRRVVVKGGGNNLYYVSESAGTFRVTHVSGMFGGKSDVGKTRSFDHALSLIRSHSGRQIDSIG